MTIMINETHNPDVLNCLANLSSDEVFTSPKIANEMLDMLPQELFANPNTTFLYFQLDVMQTWLGDVKFKESLIEREHVEDDSLYANLEDEGSQVQERLPYDASVNFEPYIGRRTLVIGATESYESIKNSYSQISYNPSVDYPKINVFNWDYDISVINDKNYFDIDKAINYDKSKKVFNVLNSINEFSFMVMKSGLKVEYYRVYAKYNETNSKWEFSEYVEKGDSNETPV